MRTPCCGLLMAALIFYLGVSEAADVRAKPVKPVLPVQVKTLGQLARYIRLHQPQNLASTVAAGTIGSGPVAAIGVAGAPALGAATGSGAAGAGNSGFTGTNVQVNGVDEADFVKTDGAYIYQVHSDQVLVIQPTPASQLAVLTSIDLGSNFYPTDLYVNDDRLVVFGSYFDISALNGVTGTATGASQSGTKAGTKNIAIPAYVGPETQALIYDISDKNNIKQIRKIGLVGNQIASRRIGNFVYLVTRQYPVICYADVGISPANPPATSGANALKVSTVKHKKIRPTAMNTTPLVRDSAKHDTLVPLPIADIFLFPGFSEPDFLTIAGFDIHDPASPVDMKAYLGAGTNIYASQSNLYVEASIFQSTLNRAPASQSGTTGSPSPTGTLAPIAFSFDESSSIYKFSLTSGAVAFQHQAVVPGTILNQFSMDESGSNFRVATSHSQFVSKTGSAVSSGVYVFDGDLNLLGKLENIAPGERIFSARFIGDRAYLVTFHRVDPLFVIGLSDPAAPAILGQLTVPGVSDYLQAYDATHLMGFGSDGDIQGHLNGFKMVMFDVTDAANPSVVSSVVVPNASSEIQYDHRALLFDPANNLLAFPLTSNGNVGPIPLSPLGVLSESGSLITQIAPYFAAFTSSTHVYSVTASGFTLRGSIPAESNDFVRRVIRIGGILYTISDGHIQALDNATLTKQGVIALPGFDIFYGFGFGFTGPAASF